MPRKTSKKSLEKLTSGLGSEIDQIARDILYKISTNEIIMEIQDSYEDDLDYNILDYYGELGEIGITCQQKKKLNGINPHYYLIIETEIEPINISAAIGAKGFRLCQVQNRNPSTNKPVSQETIAGLLSSLGIKKES